jgi:hypothetical protein
VDQPVVEVDRREVDKMFVFLFSTMAQSPAAMLPSFISLHKQQALQEKRTNVHDEIQYIQAMKGTQFPEGLMLVQ